VYVLTAHLLRAIRVWRREQESLDLTLWLWAAGGLVFPLLYAQVAVKYLIVSVAPLALLAARAAALPRRIAWGGVAVWLALSCAVSVADYKLAGYYRDLARARARPGVWFAAHWGFQWYAERGGARPVDVNRVPEKGDIVMMFEQTRLDQAAIFFMQRGGSAERLEVLVAEEPWPLRTFDAEAQTR